MSGFYAVDAGAPRSGTTGASVARELGALGALGLHQYQLTALPFYRGFRDRGRVLIEVEAVGRYVDPPAALAVWACNELARIVVRSVDLCPRSGDEWPSLACWLWLIERDRKWASGPMIGDYSPWYYHR